MAFFNRRETGDFFPCVFELLGLISIEVIVNRLCFAFFKLPGFPRRFFVFCGFEFCFGLFGAGGRAIFASVWGSAEVVLDFSSEESVVGDHSEALFVFQRAAVELASRSLQNEAGGGDVPKADAAFDKGVHSSGGYPT